MPSFTFISQILDERWVFGFCHSGGLNPQKTQNVRVDKNKIFFANTSTSLRYGDRTSSKWYLLTSCLHYGDGIAA